jgi:hypothetical protein
VRGVALPLMLVSALGLGACDGASRPGDTQGVQTLGRWEWHARLVVAADRRVTLVRMRIDTSGPGPGQDVVLVRYDFNPSAAVGAEYALTLGLELGRVRALRPGVAYPIGRPPATIGAYATIACLCEPLRADSIRGTFLLVTRGMRQLTGRVDASVYFTEWNDPLRHATYALHQRLDAIK